MIGIALDVILLALVGVALYAVLRVAGWALKVLPVSRTRVDLTERAWPVIVGVGVVVYALFAVGVLLQRAPALASLGGALVLLVLVALSWSVLRDAVAGVYLRAGRAARVGDFVRIDDVEGRVERLGWRAMVVVTPSDNEAIVPYTRVVGSAIHRIPKRAEAYAHVFSVPVASTDGREIAATKETIRRAALLCHWSSVVREPVVELTGEETLTVTVFALDAERGFEIEAAVRRAIKSAPQPKSSAGPATTRSTIYKT